MSENGAVEVEITTSYVEDRKAAEQIDPSSTPPEPKRRFVLVSRKIVSKEVPSAGPTCSNDPRLNYASTRKLPIKISHRLCQICRTIKPIADISMMTDENEKLFILLAAIFQRKLFVEECTRIYKQPAVYTCSSHYSEASTAILNMFGVGGALRIFRARPRKVSQVEKFASHLMGKQFEEDKLIHSAYMFVLNHPEAGAVTGPIIKEEDIPFEETVECSSTTAVNGILPKCFRQPRKQKLEEDSCSSSILRIIKKTTPSLPNRSYTMINQNMEHPLQCCYCLEVYEKRYMTQVPKTEQRIARWVAILGEQFRIRLRMKPANYMCRKHFPQADFSSRGRLLKTAVPNVVSQEKVLAFKLEGNTFVEVKEDNTNIKMEKGTDSEIDIEN